MNEAPYSGAILEHHSVTPNIAAFKEKGVTSHIGWSALVKGTGNSSGVTKASKDGGTLHKVHTVGDGLDKEKPEKHAVKNNPDAYPSGWAL